MAKTLTPGQKISCTLTSVPRAEGARKTIARLMRRDPVASKGLRRAQRVRRQTTIVYNRGNRDWVKRQTCAKIVQALPGQSAVIPFNVSLVPDMKAVQQYLKIEAA